MSLTLRKVKKHSFFTVAAPSRRNAFVRERRSFRTGARDKVVARSRQRDDTHSRGGLGVVALQTWRGEDQRRARWRAPRSIRHEEKRWSDAKTIVPGRKSRTNRSEPRQRATRSW